MPTTTLNTPMTGNWVLVGTGPETVFVSARSRVTEHQHNSAGVVYWVGPTASPPAAAMHGHPVTGPETRSFSLQAGESLWLRGTSEVTAIVTETDLNGQLVAPPTDAYGNGTRQYGGLSHQLIGGTSTTFALPTLGASRELVLNPSTPCFFLTGNSGVTVTRTTGPYLTPGPWLHFRVPQGHTHIAVISENVSGFIQAIEVI